MRKFTDEESAVLYARTGKYRPGAFAWMLQHKYLTRSPETKEWQLNSDGQAWLAKWGNWKP